MENSIEVWRIPASEFLSEIFRSALLPDLIFKIDTAMWKPARIIHLAPVVLLPLFTVGSLSAKAQEYQGCFLIDLDGVLVELREICPTPDQASAANLGTGDIQVTLSWNTSDDLDLSVTDPGGEVVSFFTPTTGSGGQLDVDANAGCFEQSPTPIENVFWPIAQAPEGDYIITVNLFQPCAGGESIAFTVTLLVQGNTETLRGTVDAQNPVVTFPFSLP